jgi:hypothetical protein
VVLSDLYPDLIEPGASFTAKRFELWLIPTALPAKKFEARVDLGAHLGGEAAVPAIDAAPFS